MPPKGYKKTRPLTSDDYASSIELCESASTVLAVVAKKHDDLPCLLAALTFAQQAVEKLTERQAQAGQRSVDTCVPSQTGTLHRPGEE